VGIFTNFVKSFANPLKLDKHLNPCNFFFLLFLKQIKGVFRILTSLRYDLTEITTGLVKLKYKYTKLEVRF
jgi:hypothetical protein